MIYKRNVEPYVNNNIFYNENQKHECNVTILKIENLAVDKLSKKDLNVIIFDLEPNDLNKTSGKKIDAFLEKLEQKKIKYVVARALPRCLFGHIFNEFVAKTNVPTNCFECLELFNVREDGMTFACHTLKNRIGPKLDYMKNRQQIFDYFRAFYEVLEPITICKNCVYFSRDKCNTLCFRK